MLAPAYSTSDSQSNSPNLFVITTTTTANGDSPLFSIDCTPIGSPSNTNATSNRNPMHEHDLDGSEHDGKEGAGEDEEEDRVSPTITIAPFKLGAKGNTHKDTIASGGSRSRLSLLLRASTGACAGRWGG